MVPVFIMNYFQVLFSRNLLPKHPGCPDRELSKYETVQIAKNYIRSLHATLIEAQKQEQFDLIQNNTRSSAY